jgi:hypothetical protein
MKTFWIGFEKQALHVDYLKSIGALGKKVQTAGQQAAKRVSPVPPQKFSANAGQIAKDLKAKYRSQKYIEM